MEGIVNELNAMLVSAFTFKQKFFQNLLMPCSSTNLTDLITVSSSCTNLVQEYSHAV